MCMCLCVYACVSEYVGVKVCMLMRECMQMWVCVNHMGVNVCVHNSHICGSICVCT